MSRIGKKPISIPAGVSVTVVDALVTVKGPKGELQRLLDAGVRVQVSGEEIQVDIDRKEDKHMQALWGTFASHVQNMVEGVTSGFQKKLEVNGVGYRVAMQGNDLKLEVGFSHPILFSVPHGVVVTVDKNVITLEGADKELVGQTAAEIRAVRKPEPYKGKGIKYMDEIIRRKAGKTAKTGG